MLNRLVRDRHRQYPDHYNNAGGRITMLIRIVLAILLMCSSALAGNVAMLGGGVVSSASDCTTEALNNASGTAGEVIVGDTTKIKQATSFSLSGDGCVCKVLIRLKRSSTPTGTLDVSIYSDSSGSPGSELGLSSTSLDETTLTTSFANKEFLFSSCVNLTGSTTYWLVVNSTTNTVGDVRIQYDSSGSYSTKYYDTYWHSSDGSSLMYRILYK